MSVNSRAARTRSLSGACRVRDELPISSANRRNRRTSGQDLHPAARPVSLPGSGGQVASCLERATDRVFSEKDQRGDSDRPEYVAQISSRYRSISLSQSPECRNDESSARTTRTPDRLVAEGAAPSKHQRAKASVPHPTVSSTVRAPRGLAAGMSRRVAGSSVSKVRAPWMTRDPDVKRRTASRASRCHQPLGADRCPPDSAASTRLRSSANVSNAGQAPGLNRSEQPQPRRDPS